MAKKWDCECWVTENIIHFGRCESGDAVDFEIGKNVQEMSQSESQSTYATRIYAFGSTRNIPADYRPIDETVVVNGVVQRRLMLPEGTPYIDAYPDMTTEEAIEQVVIFELFGHGHYLFQRTISSRQGAENTFRVRLLNGLEFAVKFNPEESRRNWGMVAGTLRHSFGR